MSPVTDAERARIRERPTERPVMRELWRHLGFLHWPIAADAIARMLPPGLEVDTFDGVAYVGIVPFTIPLTRTAFWPGLPLAPAFHEINLRTYVHRGGRDPGVWFFSLDAGSRLAVAGARAAYRLPYFHARIRMGEGDGGGNGEIDFEARRRRRSAVDAHDRSLTVEARFACRYRPAGDVAEAAPGTLDYFLAERYLLYAWTGRALRAARVFHRPYPIRPAVVRGLEETLTTAASLAIDTSAAPLAHYAQEVDVQIYRPHRVTDG
jgi:uncharacterized protein YqjF (DUF2071 family)